MAEKETVTATVEDNVIEAVEVTKPKRKRTAKPKATTRKAAAEIAAIAEAELTSHEDATAIAKRINDKGEVNIKNLPTQKKKYLQEIASVLDEKDLTTISSYGSDLQKAMDSYSNDFLTQQMSSKNSVESAELIANLLGELQEVDIDELEAPKGFKKFAMRFPILKKFFVSVEQIKAKYNTIQKNIDGIVKKLEATKLIAIRDNNLLQKQFENNCDYVDQLEDLILAGKMKSEQLQGLIDEMKTHASEYEDYQISDIEEYKNSLDKRLTDLIMLRYAFRQSLTQIRIIQRTNMMDANNTESQITMTIPLWKNQLSLAVALYNQKQSLEVKNKVTNATNEILRKNAEMMKVQAIEVAKQNQRTVIDIETLRKTTSDLLATVEGVQKAQREGAEKRAAAEAEILKLDKEMQIRSLGLKESTEHVIAKELKGIRDSR